MPNRFVRGATDSQSTCSNCSPCRFRAGQRSSSQRGRPRSGEAYALVARLQSALDGSGPPSTTVRSGPMRGRPCNLGVWSPMWLFTPRSVARRWVGSGRTYATCVTTQVANTVPNEVPVLGAPGARAPPVMKTTRKSAATKRIPRRDLFAELSEGVAALAGAREGKRTLRTHAVTFRPPLTSLLPSWSGSESSCTCPAHSSRPACARIRAPWRTGSRGAPSPTPRPRC
jgi:hypothetical protein